MGLASSGGLRKPWRKSRLEPCANKKVESENNSANPAAELSAEIWLDGTEMRCTELMELLLPAGSTKNQSHPGGNGKGKLADYSF
jgi:hypothetical protein